ncbi:MAG: IscS subfamily cysteine desulfurase [Treponema sp.]|jgi:cysteine desulfurase|nr:IscS subfamily cysteine desulfurase [Treponema sp.]
MNNEIKKVYIDHNATTPLRPEVKAAMIEDLEIFGNASSMHASGRLAKGRIEKAREAIRNLIGAKSGTVVFTSGGSEANNTVFQTMRSLAHGRRASDRNEFLISAIEHPCVMNSALSLKDAGFKVTVIPVDECGKLKINEFEKALSDKTLFVSVMTANNEIGTVQDIKEITALVKKCGAFFHVDAVQAVGKIPVNVEQLDVDYLTISAHKIYGPKGVGALYVKKSAPLFPLVHGGHQEDGLRAGTYNNAGILGFGKAAEIAAIEIEKYEQEISLLRDRLKKGLLDKIPNIHINGHPKDVLPNTLNVSFPGAEGEAILLSMDMQGIEASTGSACASGSLEPSHVLLATGLRHELAHGSIRFSLGWGNTESDIDYVVEVLPPIIARLRVMSTLTDC